MHTIKSHFKALGLYNFIRGFGWAYNGGLISGWACKQGVGLILGWAYRQNKRVVSEQRDKTYPRNKLKLTYPYIKSYIF